MKKKRKYDNLVKSEYCFLQSVYCLDYILQSEDYSLVGLGKQCIHEATRLLDDGEYKLVKLMFEYLSLDYNAYNIVQLHENIHQRCPTIKFLENTLFNTEYLTILYEKCRYFSLIDSIVKLQEKMITETL